MGLKILSNTAINNASGGVKEVLIQFVNDESSTMNYLSGTVKIDAGFLDKSETEKIKEVLRLIKLELYPEPFNEDLISEVQAKLIETNEQVREIKKNAEEVKTLSDLNFTDIMDQIKKVTKTILKSDISEGDYQGIISSYQDWEQDKAYSVGEIVKFNSVAYETIQAHTSQADWAPGTVSALFKVITPKTTVDSVGDVVTIIPAFVQPTGAHDSYQIGDKIHFEGVDYVSIIDNNTYSPADYSAGWEVDQVE